MDELNVLCDLYEDNGHDSMAGRVYDSNALAPTIGASHFQQIKHTLEIKSLTERSNEECLSRAEQSRAEQSRAEQSRAEQSRAA